MDGVREEKPGAGLALAHPVPEHLAGAGRLEEGGRLIPLLIPHRKVMDRLLIWEEGRRAEPDGG